MWIFLIASSIKIRKDESKYREGKGKVFQEEERRERIQTLKNKKAAGKEDKCSSKIIES